MLENFATLLSEANYLDRDQLILVGLSGGADSLCLFHLLHRLGYKLVVAHFNHNLRLDSDEDAYMVRNLAVANNVPFILGSEDVKLFAKVNRMSIEESARILRYEFLFSQATKVGAQFVAVGHHADDQVESVLMHLLRGSGLAGLRGMQEIQKPNLWSSEIALFRPLLRFWRDEINAYCLDQGLIPLSDYTNQDLMYWRNRIRLELIPFLETYNPQVKQALLRLSQTVSGDYQIVETQSSLAWEQSLYVSGEGYLAFYTEVFNSQPMPLRRMLIRRSIEKINSNLRNNTFDMIERAVALIKSPPLTKKDELGVGLKMFWEQNLVWLIAESAEIPYLNWPQVQASEIQPLILTIPGVLDLGDGWCLNAVKVDDSNVLKSLHENTDPYRAWLKIHESTESLLIRNRINGDRFKPFGLAGHSQKLSDYMINAKIPARSRSQWPLVCSQSEILWIPGYTISESARVSEKIENKTTVVFLQLTRS